VLQSADASSPHDGFFWLLGGGKNAQWAVRRGDWKLLGNATDKSDRQREIPVDRLFLANLKEDLGERRNLAAERPDLVQELKRLMEANVLSINQETR